jgi:ubiquinone/menaquinone biosynthesis C-methylase UbiE
MTGDAPLGTEEWGSDAQGRLNQAPPELVAAMIDGLEDFASAPAFKAARRALFGELRLSHTSILFEGGCGTGAALPDLVDVMGRGARITATDPTVAFIERARARARELGAENATYETGLSRHRFRERHF